jgi:hypothetical protein
MEVSGHIHAPAVLPPREINAGTHCIGVWVGLRASLNTVEKRKSLIVLGLLFKKDEFFILFACLPLRFITSARLRFKRQWLLITVDFVHHS